MTTENLSVATSRRRAMGSVERAMFTLERRAGCGHIVKVFQLSGMESTDQLIDAVRRLPDIHAVLGARVGQSATSPGTPEIEIAGLCPSLSVHPTRDLLDAYTFELNDPFKDGSSPLRLRVVTSDDGVAACLSLHHAIVDGRSSNMVLRDLVSGMNGVEAQRTTGIAPPIEMAMPKDKQRPEIEPELERFVEDQGLEYSEIDVWSERRPSDIEPPKSRVAVHTLPPAAWQPLIALSRRADFSVSNLLVGCAAAALSRVSGLPPEQPVPVATTVDLRPLLPTTTETLGAYMSGSRASVRVGLSERETVLALSQKYTRENSLRLGACAVYFQEMAVTEMIEHRLQPPAVAISNVGTFAPPQDGRVRLEAVGGAVPMHGGGPAVNLNATTYDGSLRLMCVFDESRVRAEHGLAFFDEFCGRLARFSL